jgi:hypothetical protein
MISRWIRIIGVTSGPTTTDHTLAAQNSDTIAAPLDTAATLPVLYIGQHFPFNNLFFEVNTANSNSADLVFHTWDGSAFNLVDDQLDETKSSGATLARDGVVQFSPDADEFWDQIEDTSDSDGPTELQSLSLYNLYWLRVSASDVLSAGTVLDKIAYRFANTQQLDQLDPDLSQYLTSWTSGKTDWNEQLIVASDMVVSDLKRMNKIKHPGNILRIDEISWATAYKTLSMIYTMLGPDFTFRKEQADKEYKRLINMNLFTFDSNIDGVESAGEITRAKAGLVR